MDISPYLKTVLTAFNAVRAKNGGQGASAKEVTDYMDEHKTLAAYDSVIDIADQLDELASKGLIRGRASNI